MLTWSRASRWSWQEGRGGSSLWPLASLNYHESQQCRWIFIECITGYRNTQKTLVCHSFSTNKAVRYSKRALLPKTQRESAQGRRREKLVWKCLGWCWSTNIIFTVDYCYIIVDRPMLLFPPREFQFCWDCWFLCGGEISFSWVTWAHSVFVGGGNRRTSERIWKGQLGDTYMYSEMIIVIHTPAAFCPHSILWGRQVAVAGQV